MKYICLCKINRLLKNILSVSYMPLLLLLPQRCNFMFRPQDGENLKF